MKVLTKEEEQAHYHETLKGGSIGGAAGLALGFGGVFAAGARYPAFRHLTLPLKAFLVTSSATFGGMCTLSDPRSSLFTQYEDTAVRSILGFPESGGGFGPPAKPAAFFLSSAATQSANMCFFTAIVTADHFSRSFEASRHPDEGYQDEAARLRAEQDARKSPFERFMAFGKEYRYPIVATSWVLGMGVALGVVGRSPYLSTQQKLVQARVYAQTITIAVLCATAVFEVGDRGKGEGRWETVKIVDPNDPTHKHLIEKKVHHERYEGEDQWRDMVEAEERKMKEREAAAHAQDKHNHKQHEKKKSEHKEEKKDENKK